MVYLTKDVRIEQGNIFRAPGMEPAGYIYLQMFLVIVSLNEEHLYQMVGRRVNGFKENHAMGQGVPCESHGEVVGF